jgi:hypothetical protein
MTDRLPQVFDRATALAEALADAHIPGISIEFPVIYCIT